MSVKHFTVEVHAPGRRDWEGVAVFVNWHSDDNPRQRQSCLGSTGYFAIEGKLEGENVVIDSFEFYDFGDQVFPIDAEQNLQSHFVLTRKKL